LKSDVIAGGVCECFVQAGAYWDVSPLRADVESLDGRVNSHESVAHLVSGCVPIANEFVAVECLICTVDTDLVPSEQFNVVHQTAT